jgi:hypothetical protein
MTILTVGRQIARRCGLAVPTTVATATERAYVELAAVINDAAREIAEGYDWQILRGVHTLTGDGSAEAFDLPTDYDRMLVKSQVWSSSLETPLSPISDHDEWLGLDVQSFDFVINAWTIYGGQMRIKPALANGVTAKFFYVSNKIFASSGGTAKAEFTADDDTFRIDETLLALTAIWRWKQSKGQVYGEEMQDAERRKERLVGRDKGSRMLRLGRVGSPRNVQIAYPQSITG